MTGELTISVSSESLDSGSAEERATFGMFVVAAHGRPLTAGVDASEDALRSGPHVSGYPLAEWFAWNWWRLRWELGRPAVESAAQRWDFAHRMSTVGEGYAWPDIAIFSDGRQSFLVSEPSQNPDAVMFRYIGASRREAVSMESLESAIDEFVEDVLTRLDGQELRDTNLHRLWSDLKTEREDPELARFRRLEAQLGYDPDEADEGDIRDRLNDAGAIGEGALREAAADEAAHGGAMSAKDFENVAKRSGFDANPNDAVALSDPAGAPRPGEIQAGRIGQRLARSIRNQPESADGARNHMTSDLMDRAQTHDSRDGMHPTGCPQTASTGDRSDMAASLPKPGECVDALLLNEKTGKGGWKAKHEPTDLQGPIHNSVEVPDDAAAGQRVMLIVAHANPHDIAFNWPTPEARRSRSDNRHRRRDPKPPPQKRY